MAFTGDLETVQNVGASGQPGGLRPSTVMLKVRTSVINSTFDGDHAATEWWSPASVSESSMITPHSRRSLCRPSPKRAASLEGVDDLAIRLLRKCFHGHRADIPKPTQHQGKSRRDGVVWSVENADKVVLSHRQIKRLHVTAHVRQHRVLLLKGT